MNPFEKSDTVVDLGILYFYHGSIKVNEPI